MDVHSDYVETVSVQKYNLSFDTINYFKAEDSGYHTSFTPGSLEHSQLSSGFLDQSVVATAFIDPIQVDYVTPEPYKYNQLKPRNDNCKDTPSPRRAVKRPFSSIESKKQTTIPTPTTWIAGKIQGLEVSEDKENNTLPSDNSHRTERNARYIYRLNICEQKFSYPITPVKRNCKLSPCRKSGRKLDFVIHSIACENHGLQQTPQQVTQTRIRPTQPIVARPDQNKKRNKIDILGLLHQHSAIPPLKNIFWYLSNEDICNFCCVSSTWKDIWNLHSSSIKKEELRKHLKSARENQENCLKKRSIRIKATNLNDGSLKEINNFIKENPTPSSPQYSPKTNRFREFIKVCFFFILYCYYLIRQTMFCHMDK